MLVRLYTLLRDAEGSPEEMRLDLCVDFESKIKKIDFCNPVNFRGRTYLWCEIKDAARENYLALNDELELAFQKQKGEL